MGTLSHTGPGWQSLVFMLYGFLGKTGNWHHYFAPDFETGVGQECVWERRANAQTHEAVLIS